MWSKWNYVHEPVCFGFENFSMVTGINLERFEQTAIKKYFIREISNAIEMECTLFPSITSMKLGNIGLVCVCNEKINTNHHNQLASNEAYSMKIISKFKQHQSTSITPHKM